jgi:putative oxidoreductase
MSELKFLPQSEPRIHIGDWAVRGGIAVLFFLAGLEKFASTPGSHWVTMFEQIGAGVWFRYFTGIMEAGGALLALAPKTALIGLAMLACTMVGAVVILVFVLRQPSDSVFSGALILALIAVAFNRLRIDRAKAGLR